MGCAERALWETDHGKNPVKIASFKFQVVPAERWRRVFYFRICKNI
jgi:hypothetical protein